MNFRPWALRRPKLCLFQFQNEYSNFLSGDFKVATDQLEGGRGTGERMEEEGYGNGGSRNKGGNRGKVEKKR